MWGWRDAVKPINALEFPKGRCLEDCSAPLASLLAAALSPSLHTMDCFRRL